MRRGEVWWAELGIPAGSGPGYRRPVVIVQSNAFNRSYIRTAVAVAITSNVKLAAAPGNVSLSKGAAGLPVASVVNISQIITVDQDFLTERIGRLPAAMLRRLDDGLRLVLALQSPGD